MNKRSIDAYLFLLVAFCFAGLLSSATAQADSHGAFGGLIKTVNQVRAGAEIDPSAGEGSGDGEGTTSAGCSTTAAACYINVVDPIVQQSCVVCHQQGLTADQQGARLLFTDSAADNHAAIEAFVTSDGVGANWLLGKIVGDLSHGGGPVLAQGGDRYLAFADYLTLLVGANTDDGSVETSELWLGTVAESREITLRRAASLLAGKAPTPEALERAALSDTALKNELVQHMSGDDFHEFLVTAANDRLLTDGLNNGIDWQFDFRWRFPAYYAFELGLPDVRPDQFDNEEYWGLPFLTRNDANFEVRVATTREPLELIAYIVENDRSYKEVVTADYTMVNQFTALAYQADVTFDEPIVDERGFYNRKHLNTFRPAKNFGHVPFTNDNYFDEETGDYRITEYHEWPHAGVLSMPAWLGRYPSTDTNRNRARARWTYYQFLDVDIEKSAPRTTDPVALADTNNPTMNNSACTVCHERMDPVAGAYQSFGDQGHYLNQHGGLDSLPDFYKNPQRADGDLYELQHDSGTNWGRYQFHEVSTPVTTAKGGNFAISNPDPCIEDTEMNTDDEWFGWCSRLGVADITVYASGSQVLKLQASEFEDYAGFSVSTYTDSESGEQRPQGDLNGNVYQLHHDVWMAFDFDLPEGDYEIVLTLATQQDEGYPEPFVLAGLLWNEGLTTAAKYQYGDTWYRDMRSPGFNGRAHKSGEDSIVWLGHQIAEDPRFPNATVKFWWPSVFGTEALTAPTDRSLINYDAQLLAFNAQEALVEELANAFVASDYNVKSLLADMVLSPWFRTTAVDQGLSDIQQQALETVGRGRLLTPEELDRKNRAVFGRTWGQPAEDDPYSYTPRSNFSDPWRGYATFYGGIDSAAVTSRNRDKTPLMSNVTEKMAVELACQVVLQDFNRPIEKRLVFTEVERTTDPAALAAASHVLERNAGPKSDLQIFEREIEFTTSGGEVALKFRDATPQACVQDLENSTESEWVGWCSHIGIMGFEIHSGNRLIRSMTADQFSDSGSFAPQTWTDTETGEVNVNGWFQNIGSDQAYLAHSNSEFSFNLDLAAGDYTVTAQMVATATQGHPNDSVTVALTARTQGIDSMAPAAQAVAKQLDLLYLRATGNALAVDTKSRLLEAFLNYANAAAAESDWYNGHCDQGGIWGWEQRTAEENDRLFADPIGGMQAWTLMVHALMTSFSYLHD